MLKKFMRKGVSPQKAPAGMVNGKIQKAVSADVRNNDKENV
jgi:hypothetical protein